jgi:hypothetical protein
MFEFNPEQNQPKAAEAEVPIETAEGQREFRLNKSFIETLNAEISAKEHDEAMDLMRVGYEGTADERLEEMLANLRPGALAALKAVDSAKTDAVLRRRNINTWYKEWEREEAA